MSRNYEPVPHVGSQVTITSQGRIAQTRPPTVMRPQQTIQMRKIQPNQDGPQSSSSYGSSLMVKHDVVDHEVEISTSQPSTSGTSFQQYQRGAIVNPINGSQIGSMDQPLPLNQANKQRSQVAEVFLTAGHAFQKLGDLTMQLHSYSGDTEECKWSEKEVEQLRDSLTRFAHDLDQISQNVSNSHARQIKNDIKRRHNDDLNQQAKRVAYSTGTGMPTTLLSGTIGTIGTGTNQNTVQYQGNNMHTAPLNAKRVTTLGTNKLITGRIGVNRVTVATPTMSSSQLAQMPQLQAQATTSSQPSTSAGPSSSTSQARLTTTLRKSGPMPSSSTMQSAAKIRFVPANRSDQTSQGALQQPSSGALIME